MNKLDEDNPNWEFVKISKIDNKTIKKLVENLNLGLSEDFYFSIESILKLGKKAETILEYQIREMDDHYIFKKEFLKILLNFIKNNEIENPILFDLFHPDFVVRARALKEINRIDALKYLHLILPLISDPDDSVRWAVIELLTSINQLENPIIYKKLKTRLETESNPIIQKKLKEILKIN